MRPRGRWRHRWGTLVAPASLVAREYGIPAVVVTGDATTRLSDGQRVTVNGGAAPATHTPDRDGVRVPQRTALLGAITGDSGQLRTRPAIESFTR